MFSSECYNLIAKFFQTEFIYAPTNLLRALQHDKVNDKNIKRPNSEQKIRMYSI